jgi:hypothetical protein
MMGMTGRSAASLTGRFSFALIFIICGYYITFEVHPVFAYLRKTSYFLYVAADDFDGHPTFQIVIIGHLLEFICV